MQIDQCRFRRRQHEFHVAAGRIRDFVHFVPEFRKLSGHITAFIVEHMRRQHQLIAVREVLFNKEIQQRPLQPGTCSAVNPGTGTRQFSAPRIINHAQRLAQLDMIFRHKIKHGFFFEIVQHRIVFLAAGHDVGVRDVRQRQQKILLLLFQR